MGYIMIFYVFDTEAEAIAAENTIVSNIKTWVETYSPSVVVNGEAIKGRRPSTGEVVFATTSKWADPKQRLDEKWVFEKPQDHNVTPIPLSSVIANVTANEEQFNSDWFPEPETL